MRVGVLLSGGVDSTFVAYLLQKEGYEVVGFYLKLHQDELKHQKNIQTIRKIEKKLGIQTHIIDAQEKFKKEIYEYFVDSYKRGVTPNPCSMCNPKIKFGFALKKAEELGCKKLASGHYVRVKNGRIQEALDETKDQSYFLYGIEKDTVCKLLFPLGNMYKKDAKAKAFEVMPWFGEIKEYKESQEVCFVDNNYTDILNRHFEVNQKGVILDKNHKIIGTHKGYAHYTIGQRKGLDIPLAQKPHYVVSINSKKNQIYAGDQEELQSSYIKVLNFSIDEEFQSGLYFIKTRYKSKKIKAKVEKRGVILDIYPQTSTNAVAQGQSLVVYQGDVVLGGGVIADSRALQSNI